MKRNLNAKIEKQEMKEKLDIQQKYLKINDKNQQKSNFRR